MTQPKFENMMTEVLEGVSGTEVVVSHCTFPPNFSLPKHWHPGEEFLYVLVGKVTLWLDGKDAKTVSAGEALKVPYKIVHTASTGDEGVTLIAFRVHEQGQPERILVEEAASDAA